MNSRSVRDDFCYAMICVNVDFSYDLRDASC